MSPRATKHWEISTVAIPHVYPDPEDTRGLLYDLAYGEIAPDDVARLDLRWTINAPTVVDGP